MFSYNVSIIGTGFVGGAALTVFKELGINTYSYDTGGSDNTFEECMCHGDLIFLCLPAPTLSSGNVDVSIYDTVLSEAKEHLDSRLIAVANPPIFVIKGTLPPGTNKSFRNKYGLHIVSNPEFLTARTNIEDFRSQSQIVLGGDDSDVDFVGAFYNIHFPDSKITKVDSTTAEMIKYTCNVFYSVKISFFNEVYDACKKLNISYNDVISSVLQNGWVSCHHTLVPGPDGDLGFSGLCFPKDMKALVKFFEKNDIVNDTIKGALKTNEKVRKK